MCRDNELAQLESNLRSDSSVFLLEHAIEGCPCEGKRCTSCKKIKCTGSFHRHKRCKDGLNTQCKACVNAVNKQYKQEHSEYYREYTKTYQQEHSEERREYKQAWYQANKERYKEYAQRKRRKAPPKQRQKRNKMTREQRKLRKKAYRESCAEQIRTYNQAYYRSHEEYNRNRRKLYLQSHPEKFKVYYNVRRTRKTQAGGSFTFQQWEELKVYYSHTCLCCGRQEPDITLTVDHVTPISRGGTSNIDNIQPLCLSCNSSKKDNIIDYRTQFCREVF
jgi:5-methylcytosine-specific restriction endonuclease McrA